MKHIKKIFEAEESQKEDYSDFFKEVDQTLKKIDKANSKRICRIQTLKK